MDRQQLRSIFCARFHCPPSAFEERAFKQCLYWHAKFLAPLLRGLKPDFFAEDLKFIRYLGDAQGLREAGCHALDFQEANRARRSWLRTGLRIRVSGRKAQELAHRLFSEARRPEG